jgi:elongation factor G
MYGSRSRNIIYLFELFTFLREFLSLCFLASNGTNTHFPLHNTGTNIPPEYIKSCKQGAEDAMEKGGLVGAEVSGMRVTLNDGASHAVDSSDMAFRIATSAAVREAMRAAKPQILEPIMKIEIQSPQEFQGAIVSGINQRMGLIHSSDPNADGSGVTIVAEVPLAQMFGYSTNLRSITQGKGEFSMEYSAHQPVNRDTMETLIKEHKAEQAKAA